MGNLSTLGVSMNASHTSLSGLRFTLDHQAVEEATASLHAWMSFGAVSPVWFVGGRMSSFFGGHLRTGIRGEGGEWEVASCVDVEPRLELGDQGGRGRRSRCRLVRMSRRIADTRSTYPCFAATPLGRFSTTRARMADRVPVGRSFRGYANRSRLVTEHQRREALLVRCPEAASRCVLIRKPDRLTGRIVEFDHCPVPRRGLVWEGWPFFHKLGWGHMLLRVIAVASRTEGRTTPVSTRAPAFSCYRL